MNQLSIDFKNNPIIKEYSLRIVPSSEVYHEVFALKEEFRTTFEVNQFELVKRVFENSYKWEEERFVFPLMP